MKRRARWLMLLPLLLAIVGFSASALAVRPAPQIHAVRTAGLPAVSRHHSFWLVRTGERYQAFADKGSGWRSCLLKWEENAERFADYCGVGIWDRQGRILGGVAPRNLDEFTITTDTDGFVTIDLSKPKKGAPSPLQVLTQYLTAPNRDQRWSLIHPNRRTPETHQRFSDAQEAAPIQIAKIEGQRRLHTWDDKLKQHGISGGRTWTNVQELQIQWDSGDRQTIHFVLDDDGAWRLLWSPAFALE